MDVKSAFLNDSNGTPNNLGPDFNGKAVNETQDRNSNYAGCNMDRKSTSAKAEYVVVAGCCANILWMKSQLTNYDIIYEKVPIFCDNTSAIAISNNPVLHSRTKHIDIRYHFIKDHILKWDIELHFIPTQYQLADNFTKPLDEPTFKKLIVKLGYNGEIRAKGTLKKSCLPPRWRFISLLLEHMAPKYDREELTINPSQAIYNQYVPVDSKAPKYSSPTKEAPQGKTHEAKSGLKRKRSLKHTSESTTEASKSHSGHSKKETKFSLAKDTSPSHPLPLTPVVGEMHKEAQQAAGGPTSLGATSEDEAHPQLSSDSTAKADPDISTSNDFVPQQHDTRSAFFTPDSPTDEPIIISDESEKDEEVAKDKDTEDTSLPVEFLNLPNQVSLVQEKLQTLDLLLSILHKVINTLNRFSTMVDNTSGAPSMNVPLACQATASPAKREKNTKDVGTNLKDELIGLLGKDVVTQYYTKKLLLINIMARC
uniref:Retrovirus-related Pol polyprotein from transposon TNT 1-94 n=1 Tax=Tanacetum cinerariifolium TaxID=118510 RepID=A0A6L2MC17_TANCI|nr:hypothetical protein [Tanacetum cinerariifolium]